MFRVFGQLDDVEGWSWGDAGAGRARHLRQKIAYVISTFGVDEPHFYVCMLPTSFWCSLKALI